MPDRPHSHSKELVIHEVTASLGTQKVVFSMSHKMPLLRGYRWSKKCVGKLADEKALPRRKRRSHSVWHYAHISYHQFKFFSKGKHSVVQAVEAKTLGVLNIKTRRAIICLL
eukprot:GHVT01068425.1.p2 GENE.GHVT01068425.1~~GHVT01068425.1.p2  ORF type:complete len:112 (-),score=1.01 GHVT01068425.1:674-1009(-)